LRGEGRRVAVTAFLGGNFGRLSGHDVKLRREFADL
jgi:hypothetical protein